MLTTIHLAGPLGSVFRPTWQLDLNRPCPAEAVAALIAICPGFQQYVLTNSEPGYHVFVDKHGVGPRELCHPSGSSEITIVPVLQGSGGDPISKIVIGTVLIAAGVGAMLFVPVVGELVGGALVANGVGMFVGGVTDLLFPAPKVKQPAEHHFEDQPNNIFNGPVNTTAIGHPVPICYGELEIGSQVISAGISNEWHGRGAFGGDGDDQRGPGGELPDGGSCPAPWVPILLPNGDTIPAGNLRTGMLIRTQHEKTLRWGNHVVVTVSLANNIRWDVSLNDGRIICLAFNHRIYVDGLGWKEVHELRQGDRLIGDKPGTVHLAKYRDRGPVVKIGIEDAHTYQTSGILSHNIKRTPDLG